MALISTCQCGLNNSQFPYQQSRLNNSHFPHRQCAVNNSQFPHRQSGLNNTVIIIACASRWTKGFVTKPLSTFCAYFTDEICSYVDIRGQLKKVSGLYVKLCPNTDGQLHTSTNKNAWITYMYITHESRVTNILCVENVQIVCSDYCTY